MKKIFKYELRITDSQYVSMPYGANILSAQFQNGVLCIWVLVDPLCESKKYKIAIFGTGHEIENPDYLVFIDTVQVNGFVWHVFHQLN